MQIWDMPDFKLLSGKVDLPPSDAIVSPELSFADCELHCVKSVTALQRKIIQGSRANPINLKNINTRLTFNLRYVNHRILYIKFPFKQSAGNCI
jgi:hypothetical protein